MGIIQQVLGKAGGCEGIASVVGIATVEKNLATDGPVKEARIEVRQAEMRRQSLGNRSLARSGWTVDSDDHADFFRLLNAFASP